MHCVNIQHNLATISITVRHSLRYLCFTVCAILSIVCAFLNIVCHSMSHGPTASIHASFYMHHCVRRSLEITSFWALLHMCDIWNQGFSRSLLNNSGPALRVWCTINYTGSLSRKFRVQICIIFRSSDLSVLATSTKTIGPPVFFALAKQPEAFFPRKRATQILFFSIRKTP